MTKYTVDRVPRLQRLNHTPQITAISQYLLPIKLHVRIDSQGEPSRTHRHPQQLSTIFAGIKFHPAEDDTTKLSADTTLSSKLCKYGCAQLWLLLLLLSKGIVARTRKIMSASHSNKRFSLRSMTPHTTHHKYLSSVGSPLLV